MTMMGGGRQVEVSVVIPHYRQAGELAECIASLERQSLDRARFEIIVVDNNSPGALEQLPPMLAGKARLLVETEPGAGPARNRGVAAAMGEILAFIDADCKAEPDWLREGLKGLQRYDIVGGQVAVSVADPAAMTGPEAFERVFAFDFRNYIEHKGFTGSGNLFCRKSVFETVGGFRAAVSEDKDWCQRAMAQGFSLGYHGPAAIMHPARRSWAQLTRKWGRLNREALALAASTPGGKWRWWLRNWLLPVSIVPHAIKLLTSPKLPTMAARMRGLGTLMAIRLWRFFDAQKAFAERSIDDG